MDLNAQRQKAEAFRRMHDRSRILVLVNVWDALPDLETRTIETHVKRLREKLGGAHELVQTVRGLGYRVRPPNAADR